jgi:hypothetical protein
MAIAAVVMTGPGHAEAAFYPELPVAPTPGYWGSFDATSGLGAYQAAMLPGWRATRTSALTHQPQAVLWRTSIGPVPTMLAIPGVAWPRPATMQADFLVSRSGRLNRRVTVELYGQQPTTGVFSPAPQPGVRVLVTRPVGPPEAPPYFVSR